MVSLIFVHLESKCLAWCSRRRQRKLSRLRLPLPLLERRLASERRISSISFPMTTRSRVLLRLRTFLSLSVCTPVNDVLLQKGKKGGDSESSVEASCLEKEEGVSFRVIYYLSLHDLYFVWGRVSKSVVEDDSDIAPVPQPTYAALLPAPTY